MHATPCLQVCWHFETMLMSCVKKIQEKTLIQSVDCNTIAKLKKATDGVFVST